MNKPPDYLMKSFYRHVKIIINYVDDKGVPRVADAKRLARKELNKLEKYINE